MTNFAARVNSKSLIVLLAVILLGAIGCNTISKRDNIKGKVLPFYAETVADTIVYDVLLRPLDTTNVWEAEQLKYLNQLGLINHIFESIYSKKYSAYDFFSGKPLSVNEIQSMERVDGFSRKKVSKVQFKELWYLDSLGALQKHIYSYTLGIEAYSDKNTFLGHKALFEVRVE
jgi:hypothetical protein